ncbi:MAG: hypothetical protein J6T26_04820 [Firmicutes bacterium]|nr:hypothetical protein [Bacillota bacterium]
MFYVIEITIVSGTAAKAVWDKESLEAAKMQFHQTLASAMANPNVSSCLCMVIDGRGAVINCEYWERTDVSE